MLLQRLREYGERLPLPPPMYQPVAIRYEIMLDADGAYRGIVPLGGDAANKRGIVRLAPDCKRSVSIRPKLLADNAEYVLGVAREGSKPERVRAQHEAFVALMRNCAAVTKELAVEAVMTFLDTLDTAQLGLPPDFDPSMVLTFEVDGDYPIDLPSVRAYWARAAGVEDDVATMQCLVCGEQRPPVERLQIPIKGIPGGQVTGMALISANAAAFESYGLSASLIAPTCEECGQRFGNALNMLLKEPDTHLRIDPIVYAFWTREPAPFSFARILSTEKAEDVKEFLSAPWRGNPEAARLEESPFYAVALSASGARVVVRDWVESTLEEAKRHLARYFALQRLRDAVTGEFRWFALRQLAYATINSNSAKEEPAPQVGQSLLHVALHGGPLPDWLLYQAVRRLRAEPNAKPHMWAARVALIKMVLLPQLWERGELEGRRDMAELDGADRTQAYLCGRLLAELEAIQRAALGDVNATIVDRYYGTASSAPASVFGRLMRGAQPHLSKLRRDPNEAIYRSYDARLQEILDGLPAFPRTLTLQEQGRFALGFYHQKAENRRRMLAAKAAKGRTTAGQDREAGEQAPG